MKTVIKYLISLIFAIIIVLFIQTFVIRGAVVSEDNMSPTIIKGDRLIVNKIKVTFNLLDTGDIIMYKNDGHTHFGRIIGKPPKHYFVLNDNDHNQSDSRRYGLIDKQNIIGDISIKYYPFEAFTTDFK